MSRLPHQLTENVKLLQKVVLMHKGKALVLKREEDSFSRPLFWDLPGGNSEWPQTLENKEGLYQKDAAREVVEETGIEISPEEFTVEKIVTFSTFFEAQRQVYSIIVGWCVQLDEDFERESIKLSSEHIKYAWIDADELDEYNFGGSKGGFVKKMVEKCFED